MGLSWCCGTAGLGVSMPVKMTGVKSVEAFRAFEREQQLGRAPGEQLAAHVVGGLHALVARQDERAYPGHETVVRGRSEAVRGAPADVYARRIGGWFSHSTTKSSTPSA